MRDPILPHMSSQEKETQTHNTDVKSDLFSNDGDVSDGVSGSEGVQIAAPSCYQCASGSHLGQSSLIQCLKWIKSSSALLGLDYTTRAIAEHAESALVYLWMKRSVKEQQKALPGLGCPFHHHISLSEGKKWDKKPSRGRRHFRPLQPSDLGCVLLPSTAFPSAEVTAV